MLDNFWHSSSIVRTVLISCCKWMSSYSIVTAYLLQYQYEKHKTFLCTYCWCNMCYISHACNRITVTVQVHYTNSYYSMTLMTDGISAWLLYISYSIMQQHICHSTTIHYTKTYSNWCNFCIDQYTHIIPLCNSISVIVPIYLIPKHILWHIYGNWCYFCTN